MVTFLEEGVGSVTHEVYRGALPFLIFSEIVHNKKEDSWIAKEKTPKLQNIYVKTTRTNNSQERKFTYRKMYSLLSNQRR